MIDLIFKYNTIKKEYQNNIFDELGNEENI